MYIPLRNRIGPRLYTRFDGANLRNEIEPTLEHSGEQICFDFTGVEMVSRSFADECFGKLLFKVNRQKILNSIKFENASPLIESIFSIALSDRFVHA